MILKRYREGDVKNLKDDVGMYLCLYLNGKLQRFGNDLCAGNIRNTVVCMSGQ